MIYKVLKVLRDNLDTELNPQNPGSAVPDPVDIVIDNMAREDTDATAISNKIVITLLNVEEEPALKNTPRYERKLPNGYIKKNPSAYLNLYVMVAANRDNYEIALKNISKVIETLQAQKVLANEEEGFKFKVQLQPLPFDQLSYAWGLLGGKVIPSALYKVSIVKIQRGGVTDPELITEIAIKDVKNESNEK